MAGDDGCRPIDDFADVPPDCICAICFQVMVEPVRSPTCNHVFGRACLSDWLAHQNSCPLCRRPTRRTELRIVTNVQDQVQRLQGTCPHARHGCSAFFTFAERGMHLQERCAYLRCTCGQIVARAALDVHRRICGRAAGGAAAAAAAAEGAAVDVDEQAINEQLQMVLMQLESLRLEVHDSILENARQTFHPLQPRLSMLLRRCRGRVLQMDVRLDALELPPGQRQAQAQDARRSILARLAAIEAAAEQLQHALAAFQDALR